METLLVERAGHVVTVVLNRPERKNAISTDMWRELLETFEDIERRPDDRVMVITGAGGAFCSGADLGSFSPKEGPPVLDAQASARSPPPCTACPSRPSPRSRVWPPAPAATWPSAAI